MIDLLIGIAGICGLFRSLLALKRQQRIIEILSRHVDKNKLSAEEWVELGRNGYRADVELIPPWGNGEV